MNPRAPSRGRPVIALALLLGGWVAARAVIIEALPGASDELRRTRSHLTGGGYGPQFAARFSGPSAAEPVPSPGTPSLRADPQSPVPDADLAERPQGDLGGRPIGMQAAHARLALAPVPRSPTATAPAPSPAVTTDLPAVRLAAGHQLLWMAAVSQLPFPMARLGAVFRGQALSPAPMPSAAAPRRWSADGWMLLRRGGSGIGPGGPSAPSYGASQAGGVLRYRLAAGDGHRATAYLRASAALGGSADRELALGLSARPLARLPLVVAAEMRATQTASGMRLRPAVMTITQLPPMRLPAGARAEAYGQAGYVGGPDATLFADGQLRVDRKVMDLGPAELRAGAGAWAGAQKGASRLDIGPGATLGLSMGAASARLALDWRFRLSGNAAPSSGPALTLSAGF